MRIKRTENQLRFYQNETHHFQYIFHFHQFSFICYLQFTYFICLIKIHGSAFLVVQEFWWTVRNSVIVQICSDICCDTIIVEVEE